MVRARLKIGRRRRDSTNSYEKMMKTLLLQNQQIIIQQHNMMFMVMKQLQLAPPTSSINSIASTSTTTTSSTSNNNPSNSQPQSSQHQQLHQHHHHEAHHLQTQHHLIQHEEQIPQLFSQTTSSPLDTQQQLQQVASQLQENLGNYLTPAASEQDPISEKQDDDDFAALMDSDGLLHHNNLIYNPQTDIGSITPYKSHQHHHQTPSYYSSGCESLTTPRVEHQRQPTNINQNVVKNLADSFKSPTKPKINIQFMSGTSTGSMKNSKAKIIQRMNISEFLRHVHPETDETQKNSSH